MFAVGCDEFCASLRFLTKFSVLRSDAELALIEMVGRGLLEMVK